MRRKLGSVEHAFTLNGRVAPLVAVSVLHIRPAFNQATLYQAIPRLQQQHPFLQATLLTKGSHYYHEFGPDVPVIPIKVITRLHDNHWQEVATAELNQEIGHDGTALMRLTYLVSEAVEAAELVIGIHHSIIDAVSGISLLDQLLRLCTGDQEAAEKRFIALPTAETHFPAAYKGLRIVPKMAAFMVRQMADEISYRWQVRGTRPQPIHPTAQCAIVTRKLDAATTERLTRQSRRKRITINSLASAAMLLAVHHHLYDSQPGPLRPITFGNLRPFLEPPLSDENLGCMITMFRMTLNVKAGMDVWQLAAVLQDKNNAALERGEKFLAALMTKYIIKMTLQLKAFRLATTAVSYAGPLPLKPQYGPIRVTGMNSFVSNNRFGPEYVAAAYLLYGEFIWNFLYLDSDMDPETAESIADETCRLMSEAA